MPNANSPRLKTNTLNLYSLYLQHPSVQTDTRKLQKGDIFFALKGPNFNGNLFARQALDAGAAYAVVDELPAGAEPDDRLILVPDVLSALQELAAHHRNQFAIPFLAITGSNGKTTNKELISAVLGSHYITYTTKGNLNNHIGIPLTLLSVKEDAEMAVIEMGANHQREIAGYCVYTRPTHGLITNCGKAHLEGFGGEAGVRKGKGELFDFLRENGGTAFIFSEYDYLKEMSHDINEIISYGTREGMVQGSILRNEPFIEVIIEKGFSTPARISTQLVGDYNLPNILGAVCVGLYFKVPEEKIIHAIEAYQPTNSRSQLIRKGSNTIILDAYNANPNSMRAAIENFIHLPAEKKILMLGGMMELGEQSLGEHQQILDLVNQHHWQEVILVGGDFGKLTDGFRYFPNSEEAAKWVAATGPENSHILIKGSRSMQMEKILESL